MNVRYPTSADNGFELASDDVTMVASPQEEGAGNVRVNGLDPRSASCCGPACTDWPYPNLLVRGEMEFTALWFAQ